MVKKSMFFLLLIIIGPLIFFPTFPKIFFNSIGGFTLYAGEIESIAREKKELIKFMNNKSISKDNRIVKIIDGWNTYYTLDDFFSSDGKLKAYIDAITSSLTDEELASQMIITSSGGYGKDAFQAISLLSNKKAGGVVFFENSISFIKYLTQAFTDQAVEEGFPLLPLFSIDGEPTLIRGRFKGSINVPLTEEIESVEKCREVVEEISYFMLETGIHVNYAPVCDLSFNTEIIGSRSFGSDPEKVLELTGAFIDTTQKMGLVATAKHFPGHGSAPGDSHRRLVYTDGESPEIAVFRGAIKNGVIMMMVGHIAVINNHKYGTYGRPASISRNIVTDLLKEELGFRGIVITDAMFMRAVTEFDEIGIEAVKAGCDMVLAPLDETALAEEIVKAIRSDPWLKQQIVESVKKIVKLKVCLGLINREELSKRLGLVISRVDKSIDKVSNIKE